MSTTVIALSSTLGWVGAIGTVLAYALVSQHVLAATSRTFQAINAVSAALLTVSALAHDSWPSAVSNMVWVLIALVALAQSRRLAAAATPVEPEPAQVETDEHHDEVLVAA